jgi:hypothetical protein
VIKKSRYDSIDCFIANDEALKPEYNDLDLVYDPEIYAQLRESAIDDLLARHLAHLFIPDPLVVYDVPTPTHFLLIFIYPFFFIYYYLFVICYLFVTCYLLVIISTTAGQDRAG